MTLYWFDGFELYTDITHMRRVYISLGNNDIETVEVRTGIRALEVNRYTGGVRWIAPGIAETTMVFGGAVKCEYLSPTVHDQIQFIDDSGNSVLRFYFNSTGQIVVLRGGTTLGTTINPCVSITAWNYIEIKVYAHQSAGTVEIRKNGNQELLLTGIDTIESGTVIEGFELYGVYTSKKVWWDDIYFATDFLGDVRVDVLRVSGAGNTADFTPSAGANYENVDESPGPDDDATYNDGDELNEKDTYALDDMSPGGIIFGVKHQMTVKKTDAGTVKVKPVIRSGGADYLGDEKTLSTDYTTETHIWEDNPDDSNSWEEADLNAAEAGVQITDYP